MFAESAKSWGGNHLHVNGFAPQTKAAQPPAMLNNGVLFCIDSRPADHH